MASLWLNLWEVLATNTTGNSSPLERWTVIMLTQPGRLWSMEGACTPLPALAASIARTRAERPRAPAFAAHAANASRSSGSGHRPAWRRPPPGNPCGQTALRSAAPPSGYGPARGKPPYPAKTVQSAGRCRAAPPHTGCRRAQPRAAAPDHPACKGYSGLSSTEESSTSCAGLSSTRSSAAKGRT